MSDERSQWESAPPRLSMAETLALAEARPWKTKPSGKPQPLTKQAAYNSIFMENRCSGLLAHLDSSYCATSNRHHGAELVLLSDDEFAFVVKTYPHRTCKFCAKLAAR